MELRGIDMIKVGRGSGGLIISFPYNPDYTTKVKTTKGYGWHIEEKKSLSRGMYRRSSSDTLPNWKDIRSSDIPLDWSDIRSTSDMKELVAIGVVQALSCYTMNDQAVE